MTAIDVRIRMRQIQRGRELGPDTLLKLTDKVCRHYEHLKRKGVREFQYLEQLEKDTACLFNALDPLRERGEIGAYHSACLRLRQMAGTAIESPYVPLLLMILYRCAGAELMAGNAEAAGDLYRETGQRIEAMIGRDNIYWIRCLDRQAEAALALGDREEALRLYEEAVRKSAAKWGERHPMTELQERHRKRAAGEEQ